MIRDQIAAVLESVRSWPEQDQEELTGLYVTTDDEKLAVQKAKQSPLVPGDEVAAFWKRYNIG